MAYGTSKCAHYSHMYTQNTNWMFYKREFSICVCVRELSISKLQYYCQNSQLGIWSKVDFFISILIPFYTWFSKRNDFTAVTGAFSDSRPVSHILCVFVGSMEAAGSGTSAASKPSSWANLSLGLQTVFYGALCAFVPDRLAQWNDLIRKDTPFDFKRKSHAPSAQVAVVRSVILVVLFWKDGFGMQICMSMSTYICMWTTCSIFTQKSHCQQDMTQTLV